jgi:hypothetical protein
VAEGTRMLQRRGTEAQWNLATYVPGAGEICVATDTGLIKVGDGVNVWSELPNPFDLMYLPLEGTAANSELLGGIGADGFLQNGDGDDAATPDSIVQRDGSGRFEAVAGTDPLHVVNYTQLIDSKKELFGRTLADATTTVEVQVADANTMILITNNSSTVVRNFNVPLNSAVAFPVGAWVDVCNQGTGLLKLTSTGGVTVRGTQNIFPQSSVIRLLKTATNEWLAISLGNPRQGRLPKMRIYRNTGTNYLQSQYQLIPYTTIDASRTFNPSDEYFAIDPVGLTASRRIIIQKDGEYTAVGNYYSTYTSNGFLHIVKCTANNTIGETLAHSGAVQVRQCTWTGRLNAGDSIGMAQFSGGANDDMADSSAVGANRNDFTIVKIGD